MENKNAVFKDENEKWDFLIAIVVVVLVSFFIFEKIFTTTSEADLKESAVAHKVNDENRIDPILELKQAEVSKEFIVERKPIAANSDIELEKEDDFIISSFSSERAKYESKNDLFEQHTNRQLKDNKEPSFEIKKHKINAFIPQREMDSGLVKIENTIDEEIGDVSNSNKDSEKNEAPQIPKKITETDEVPKANVNNSKASNTVIAGDCIIVVGAFNDVNNKNAIIGQLTDLGYNHKEGTMKNGLNYVGVPINCNNATQRRELINALNKAFNVQTWMRKN